MSYDAPIKLDPAIHLQCWRQALDPELLAGVDAVNARVKRPILFIRIRMKKQRLKWWHWRESTITEYQVLVSISKLGDLFRSAFEGWVSRDMVLKLLKNLDANLKSALHVTDCTFQI
jgi:hypothetical protein